MEIESRLLPCGLHVVGSPPSAAEAVATLVNIAEIDRPDNDPPIAGLPGILARAIGRNMEQIYLNNNKARRATGMYCIPPNVPARTRRVWGGARSPAHHLPCTKQIIQPHAREVPVSCATTCYRQC